MVITPMFLVFRPKHELMKYPKWIPRVCPHCFRGELFLVRLRRYHQTLVGKNYQLELTVEFLPVGKCTLCTNLILEPDLEKALADLVYELTQDLADGREVDLENPNFQAVTVASVN